MTRPAPSSRAACTATWPTAPLAPSTSTCSPGWSWPRQVSAIQAAMAESPSAATRSSVHRLGSASAADSSMTQNVAMLPSPGFMPASQENQTRWPGARRSPSTTVPTPCTPGTYGKRWRPQSRMCPTRRADQVG